MTKRLLASIIGVALGTACGVVASTSPAFAAPGCSGATCVGYLPTAKDCTSDQVKLDGFRDIMDSTAGIYQQIELLYSPGCNAVWGTIWINESDPDYFDTVHLYVQREYGGIESSGPSALAVQDQTVVTTMVSWGQSIKACIQDPAATIDPVLESWYNPNNEYQPCVNWH